MDRLFVLLALGLFLALAGYLLWGYRRPRPRRPLLDEDIPIGLDEGPGIEAVTVMAREGRFGGEALERALEEMGMAFGEDGLFHYRDGEGRPLFALANVLKPGYFQGPSLEGLSTPGVLLFTESEGASGAMLDAAFRLAERLQGEVCDAHRRPLEPIGERHGRP